MTLEVQKSQTLWNLLSWTLGTKVSLELSRKIGPRCVPRNQLWTTIKPTFLHTHCDCWRKSLQGPETQSQRLVTRVSIPTITCDIRFMQDSHIHINSSFSKVLYVSRGCNRWLGVSHLFSVLYCRDPSLKLLVPLQFLLTLKVKFFLTGQIFSWKIGFAHGFEYFDGHIHIVSSPSDLSGHMNPLQHFSKSSCNMRRSHITLWESSASCIKGLERQINGTWV